MYFRWPLVRATGYAPASLRVFAAPRYLGKWSSPALFIRAQGLPIRLAVGFLAQLLAFLFTFRHPRRFSRPHNAECESESSITITVLTALPPLRSSRASCGEGFIPMRSSSTRA